MKRLSLPVFFFALSVVFFGRAESGVAAGYAVVQTIALPSPSISWDIAFVDPGSETFVLSDRTNASLDVIDGRTNRVVGQFSGFVGTAPAGAPGGSGPNGVVIVPGASGLGRGVAWAGDGQSKVKAVNLDTGAIIATVSTGGTNRADEIAYIPFLN